MARDPDEQAWLDAQGRQSSKPRTRESRAFWFCLGLGAAVFVLLANLSVSTSGHTCGTVMSPESYHALSAGELDPSGSMGSYIGVAQSASQASADAQNAACSDAIGSRRTFAILAGVVAFVVSFAGFRLARERD